MTNALSKAVIQSGLLSQATLDEFRRWRPPIDLPEKAVRTPETITEASERIAQVLEEEGLIVTRETDLEVLQRYLSTEKVGSLHVEIVDDLAEGMPNRMTDFDVSYGRTLAGDYIFAYRGETMAEEITNGLSYLQVEDQKVFFMHAREVFFGEVKAFMVCSPHLRPHMEQAKVLAGNEESSG